MSRLASRAELLKSQVGCITVPSFTTLVAYARAERLYKAAITSAHQCTHPSKPSTQSSERAGAHEEARMEAAALSAAVLDSAAQVEALRRERDAISKGMSARERRWIRLLIRAWRMAT